MRNQRTIDEYGLGSLTTVSDETLKAAALVTLIAGLGLLEVVLLAGTAFAVGARRQARDLGMLAAQGGSPRDLRRVVLAQGLLLGTLGSIGGVLLGFAAVIAGRPLYERAGNEIMVGLHFGVAEIAVAASVGVLSGLAAALSPALGASRRSTVDALAARFPAPTTRSRRAPYFGGLLIAVGVGLALLTTGGQYRSSVTVSAGPGDNTVYFDGTTSVEDAILILVGVFIVVAGLLLLTSALLAGLSRLAGRFPATLRMATRDAARHRHRTGPATAAIAVAVGSAIAISCLIASDKEAGRDRRDALPDRVIAVSGNPFGDLGPVLDAATRSIPGSRATQISYPIAQSDRGAVDNYPVPIAFGLPAFCAAEAGTFTQNDDVNSISCFIGPSVSLAVGDPDLVVIASGGSTDRAAAEAALNAGKVIVFDSTHIDPDGTVPIVTERYDVASDTEVVIHVPAVILPQNRSYKALPGAFVPESVVRANNWDIEADRTLISYPPTSRTQASQAIVAATRLGVEVSTSGSEQDYTRVVRVGLSAAAIFIGLLGVAMCVALSAAEGRPDLATLSAVGAAPSRRRRLAAAQALVLATLGTVLGIAFGFFFARAARPAVGAVETIIPWDDLFPIVAAVPVLAVVIGLLGSLGRVQVTRRAD